MFASLFIDLEREADWGAEVDCTALAKTFGQRDEITVESVGDGYRIVRLLNPETVVLAARRMCFRVGLGDDQKRFLVGGVAYYSLRCPDGFPVAALEVELPADGSGILLRIAGHCNSAVPDDIWLGCGCSCSNRVGTVWIFIAGYWMNQSRPERD